MIIHLRAVDVISKNLLHLLQPQGPPPPAPRLMLQLILSVLITSDEAYGTKTRPACELTPRQTK